jgi:predicted RNA-binding protein (virulence factor B family)
MEVDSEVSVFIMKDSENRIVATTETPHLLLGGFAYLRIAEINPFGAFADWGLDKDLFVPFREQIYKLFIDEQYLFVLKYDHETDRLFGSMKVKKSFEFCDEELTGQEVDLLICEQTELGINVIVNNKYSGLIYTQDFNKPLERGERSKGYVTKVREDGKLDVRFEPNTFEKYDMASEDLLEKLRKEKVLFLTDRSNPEDIREQLGMSKKTFKQAVGKLYRHRKINLCSDRIEFIEQ